ncbi:MAG: TIGR04076 family protein [Synergistaceae bacterium]|nr:TIGR04076 family protein [Synergistaceae bacterium]
MQHKCKVTVIDKKCFSDLQAEYLNDPKSGPCPCYEVGDEFIFERYGTRDDFWHCGINTLTNFNNNKIYIAGGKNFPQCSEAWDAISRYIYTALQGGSIMRHWTNDERMMIACCSDGTRPVIFKIERIDYNAIYIDNKDILNLAEDVKNNIIQSLKAISAVREVVFREYFIEVILDNRGVPEEMLKNAVELAGKFKVLKID